MLKKLILIGMSGITFFSVASAQSNNVYMEMMGPTLLGVTINYERIVADNIAIRVGYGSGSEETETENDAGTMTEMTTDKITHIPLGAAYLLGSGNHKLEFGAGMNMVKGTFDLGQETEDLSASLNIMFGGAGYRYQRGTGGLFVNAKAYYLSIAGFSLPWVGFGLGWTF
jgi:hypothetical protein